MPRFKFFLLLYILIIPIKSVSKGTFNYDEIYTESKNQALLYIKYISEDRSPGEYFWALNELYSSNPDIHHFIQRECLDHYYSNNLLNIFNTEGDSAKSNYRLFKAYQITNDPNLLLIYLRNLSQKQREKFYKKNYNLITELKSGKFAFFFRRLSDSKEPFNLRSFNLSDINLFNFTNITSANSPKIIALLNYWNSIKINDAFLNTLKNITVIYGYHLLDRYQKVREVSQKINVNLIPNSQLKLNYFKRVAFANFVQGYYYNNLSLYRKDIIPLSQWLNIKRDILYAHLSYGNTLVRLGKINLAQKEYEFVYNYPSARKIYKNFTSVINNLAITYLRTGNFNKYIQLQLNSLKLANEKNDFRRQLIILHNLSIYYKEIGDYSLAILYANKAKLIAQNNNLKNQLAFVDIALANIYRDKEKLYLKALKLYNSAESLINEKTDYNQWIILQSEIAHLYEVQNQFSKAIKIRTHILKVANNKGDDKNRIATIIDLANDYISIGNYIHANRLLNSINNFNKSILDFDTSVKESNAFAKIMIYKNKNDIARRELASITRQIIQRAKNSAEIQSGHLSLQDWDIESFKLLTNLYIRSDNYDKALSFIDSFKTINRAEFSNNTLLKSNILSEKQLILDQQLGNYIASLQSQLLTANANQKISIQNKLSQAITQKKQLESVVIKNFNDQPVDITKIKRNLGYRNAILYTTQFDNQYYIALITPDQTIFKEIDFNNSQIDSIKGTIRQLHSGKADLNRLYHIYQKLFGSLHLNNYRNLYVIPDGFLFQIPLGILPDADVESAHSYGSAHYMIDSHSISYYTSLKDYERTYEKSNKSAYKIDYAGFGIQNFGYTTSSLSGNKILAPLPYTKSEVSKIDSLLPYPLAKKKLFLDSSATEQSFRKWAPDAKIVHLATHSEVYYENPLFSVIYLNGDRDKKTRNIDNDGKIHAYELFEMNLDNQLVVLSSCESGAGDYITGSGIIGLSRAFTYAGAKSLVLNLWPVNDQAAEKISVKFYEYLKKGYTKAEALRKAKLYFIDNGNANPYIWGSYIETGDDSPLYSSYPYSLIGFIVVLALVCVTFSFVYFFNDKQKSKISIY